MRNLLIAKSHQLMSEIGHQNTCEVIKQKKLGLRCLSMIEEADDAVV